MSLEVSVLLGLLGLAAGDPQSPEVVITPVMHEGDSAPGIPGAEIVFVFTPHIDGAGNVLIAGLFVGSGTPPSDLGLWYGQPGALELVVVEGTQAPDLPPGVVYELIDRPRLAENGWIGFRSELSGPGIITDVNDFTAFAGPSGDIRKVMQAGDQAPGAEPGTVILNHGAFGLEPWLSDNATVFDDATHGGGATLGGEWHGRGGEVRVCRRAALKNWTMGRPSWGS